MKKTKINLEYDVTATKTTKKDFALKMSCVYRVILNSEISKALGIIETLMAAKAGPLESEELKRLMIVFEKYGDRHYPINPPDLVEAIKFRADKIGLTQNDLFL